MGLLGKDGIYRTPTVLQMEDRECGAACLGMILSYYGRQVSLDELRDVCAVGRDGCRASRILKAGEKYHLCAKGFRLDVQDLDQLIGPAIIFWNFEHFVVYEGHSSREDVFYLNDPAYGEIKVDRSCFERNFCKVVLTFAPEQDFHRNKGRAETFRHRFFNLLQSSGISRIAMLWLVILTACCASLLPAVLQIWTDYALTFRDSWRPVLMGLFCFALVSGTVLFYLVAQIINRTALVCSLKTQDRLLRRILTLPLKFFLQRSPEELHKRNISVADLFFRNMPDQAMRALGLFLSGWCFALMLCLSPELSLVLFILVLSGMVIRSAFSRQQRILNYSSRDASSRLSSSISDALEGIEDVRAGAREKLVLGKWMDLLSESTRQELSSGIELAHRQILPEIFFLSALILLPGLGGLLIIQGNLTFGQLLGFMMVSLMWAGFFLKSGEKSRQFLQFQEDVSRLDDICQALPDEIFASCPVSEPSRFSLSSGLKFSGISYTYPGSDVPAVEDLSFHLTPGKIIALAGLSGAGKTTAALLASGQLLPSSGKISLHEQDLSCWCRDNFYQEVGYLRQRADLFQGTVRENLLLFGEQADPGLLHQVLQDVQMEQELSSRGSVWEVSVEENGRNFSGGQCQRLEIARVLLRGCKYLIWDEASSALDVAAEMQILKNLRRRGTGVLLIPHRLEAMAFADEVIVLDQGKVCQRGTYQELRSNPGLLQKMSVLEKGASL